MAKQKPKKKNAKRKWLIIGPFILVALASAGYLWYKYVSIERAKFISYPAFGIDIPDSFQIHGIDVSRYQSFIDWPSVREMRVNDVHIGFAFIKATEGLADVDKQFKRNWTKAAEAGVTRGAYHFFIPTKSGKNQAKNFISNVKLSPGDLPPVLDIELISGVKPDKMRKEVQDWLTVIEDFYKVKPIIYTYVNFYSTFMQGQFDDYPLWAAHFLEKDKPRINRNWLFWQHNEAGRVNGITQPVDFNVFNGNEADFKNLLVK